MVAYVFIRVRNFCTEFVDALLLCCMPQRDNIVDMSTEILYIMDYMYELQGLICGEFERIARR